MHLINMVAPIVMLWTTVNKQCQFMCGDLPPTVLKSYYRTFF